MACLDMKNRILCISVCIKAIKTLFVLQINYSFVRTNCLLIPNREGLEV